MREYIRKMLYSQVHRSNKWGCHTNRHSYVKEHQIRCEIRGKGPWGSGDPNALPGAGASPRSHCNHCKLYGLEYLERVDGAAVS